MMRTLVLLLSTILFSFAATGQSIVFSRSQDGKYIGKHIKVYSDATKMAGITNVIAKPDSFQPYENDVVNLGVSDNIHWLKFDIENESNVRNVFINVAYPTLGDREPLYGTCRRHNWTV